MDIDVTKPKFFQFNVTIEGIDYTALSGKLEFMYEDVIYAFPTKIYKDRIEVEVPPLQSIIRKHIEETDKITARLEINGDMFHLPAWKGDMTIKRGLFIESDDPYIDDLPESKKIKQSSDENNSIYDNVLKEDIEFLRKLRNGSESVYNEKSTNEIISESLEKETFDKKETTVKRKNNKKKMTFDKKKFLKEASEQEKYAVENNVSFSETSKNDTPEQKEFRMKIRNIVQEGYIKKLKTIKKNTKTVSEAIIESPQSKEIISETFDVESINESNVNIQNIRLMMESVGMKTEKTQSKMIEHAKDKGAKSDIEIFDTIKGMLFPPKAQQGMGLQENYNKAMEVFKKSD